MSNGRVYTDGGDVYRVRIEQLRDDGTRHPHFAVRYLGPYATLGAARGQATSRRGPGRVVTVEFAPASVWQEVPE